MTRRTSARRSSKRRSSRQLRPNLFRRHDLKMYPKHKGSEEATWKWALTAFSEKEFRVVVYAFRAHQGVPRDPGLEQHFDGDAKGLKAAKAYAQSLIADKVAVAAYVRGDMYIDTYVESSTGRRYHHEWIPIEELATYES